MKRIFVATCVIAALFFTGCGKKCQKKEKKVEEITAVEKGKESKEAKNQAVPVYQSDEEKLLDFDEGDVKDFAFLGEEEEGKQDKGAIIAKKEGEEDWEDEDLTMAWENESEGAKSGFKVVNFDLNRNDIREDQKPAVVENVKAADVATKAGKNLIVAGHACQLGSPSYNLSLSEQRAKTIREEMVKGGVPEEKVTILGCGSEHPIVSSDSKDRATLVKDLAPNRRTEISVN